MRKRKLKKSNKIDPQQDFLKIFILFLKNKKNWWFYIESINLAKKIRNQFIKNNKKYSINNIILNFKLLIIIYLKKEEK